MSTDETPPPPPPAAPAEDQIYISRDGVEIGVWPASSIRPMLVSGDLKISDYFWHDGAEGWQRLITDAPIPFTLYPYLADDRPCYFIREGLLIGPRTLSEAEILHHSGWLPDDALITVFGADRWFTAVELLTRDINGMDLVSEGVRAFTRGDLATTTEIGVHAVKKAFAWLDDVTKPPPTEPPKALNHANS